MSKPVINVVKVVQAVTPAASNNVQVSVEDQAGLTRTLNLSPIAQEAMVLACLARLPFAKRGPGGGGQMREIQCQKLSLFEAQDGQLGLEICVGKDMAMHFLVPKPIQDWLLEELPRFCAEPSRKPH
jgi:hypothetical protein